MKTVRALEEGLKSHPWWQAEPQLHRIFGNTGCTDGVKWLTESAECSWLITDIAAYSCDPRFKGWGFQFWRLDVDVAKRKGMLTCRKDSDEEPAFTQRIDITDFPLPSIDIWVVEDRNGVTTIMLPCEY